MRACFYIVGFVGAWFVAAVYWRSQYLFPGSEDLLNPLHLAVVTYCSVNILICIWEIALWVHQDRVIELYNIYKKKLAKGNLPNPLFLFTDISFFDAFGLRFWADVWGTYSLLDVSYSQPGSFGYNADVGNGFSTLVPTILTLITVSNPNMIKPYGVSVRMMGFFLAWSHWQAMYGTFVYFFQYIHRDRYKDHNTSFSQFVFLVCGSNGL